jgi:diguanylate cyclase (GGDEF)-like protein/putative nucleotidyltransferase with HDIG domain
VTERSEVTLVSFLRTFAPSFRDTMPYAPPSPSSISGRGLFRKLIFLALLERRNALYDSSSRKVCRMYETQSSVDNSPLRVLVVDDDPAIRTLYTSFLNTHGCACDKAINGRDALHALMRQSFDVLVVDLRMEEMDGLVFVEEALRIWPWLGIVISSGFVTENVFTHASELGVTCVLRKPTELSDLLRCVCREGSSKRNAAADVPRDNALKLMRGYIRLLTRLTESGHEPGRLVEELAQFSGSLADILAADASGIMISRGDERAITITAQRPLTPTFVAATQTEMLLRYERLASRSIALDEFDLHIETGDGQPATADAPGRIISVPIMLDREVCGLVTLASAATAPHSPSEISLVYHAANHVSAVFCALQRMHSLATHDPLTGLLNRTRIEGELSQAWQLSLRYGVPVGTLVIDLDDFKTVNDTFGHAVGDEVLREFANIMTGVARATDFVARYGGDEFVAILPHAEDDEVAAFAKRLLHAVRTYVFCAQSHKITITLSIGAATSTNRTQPGNGPELLRQADRALYMAKRAGKDRVVVWPDVADQADITPTAPPRECTPGHIAPKARILVVDDDEAILASLAALLEAQHCTVTAMSSGQAGVDEVTANGNAYDIVLVDLAMPHVDGLAVVTALAQSGTLAVPIVMSGVGTKESAIACLRAGVYDFIDKPIDNDYLPALIARAMDYRRLRMENRCYRDNLETMVKERSSKLASALESLRASYEFTLKAFVRLLDAREKQTGEHSVRVRELAVILATQAGLKGRDVEIVASAALLHDIGKIGISDRVLLKPSSLDDDQWAIMRRHPSIGYEILRTSPFLEEAAKIVWQHHEHFDGGGYPRGIAGDDIDIKARVFAVADAYDCMRMSRIYRDAMTAPEARTEIEQHKGTQFDPGIVEAFIACQPDLETVLAAHATEDKPTC